MNNVQFEIIKNGKGFIAALDQSGGSTPKALKAYGITEDKYNNEEEMFNLIHEMRTRIIKSPYFNRDRILGAILFKITMESKIDDLYTADYLWEEKGIVPFLKVDEGLDAMEDGVQLMKPMQHLDKLLNEAREKHIFGTKMRSVIKEYNVIGIERVIKQQFKYAKKIFEAGLVPIIEPEVDINADNKEKIEDLVKKNLIDELKNLPEDTYVIFKLTLPSKPNLYDDLLNYPQVVRLVALSGGYPRGRAIEILAENDNMIASFSRALTEGLNIDQSDKQFNDILKGTIDEIYKASTEKI